MKNKATAVRYTGDESRAAEPVMRGYPSGDRRAFRALHVVVDVAPQGVDVASAWVDVAPQGVDVASTPVRLLPGLYTWS